MTIYDDDDSCCECDMLPFDLKIERKHEEKDVVREAGVVRWTFPL